MEAAESWYIEVEMEADDRQDCHQRLVGVIDQTLQRLPGTDPLLHLRMVKLRDRLAREAGPPSREPSPRAKVT